jgi:class 3 adenylate cyclase
MINKRTRDKLRKLLQERNEYPERADEVDVRIRETFGETLAVLVMDMSGFSRQTIRHGIIHFLAKIHRMQSIVVPTVEAGGGEVVKLEADNVYAVFDEVSQAVETALEINRRLDAANTMLPDELDMHGEFGIGYGEILVVEDEDIYGSEVNLASKLGEDLAERGEILLTESAYARAADSPRQFQRIDLSISGIEIAAYRVSDNGR